MDIVPDINDKENRIKIAESVLRDTGKIDSFMPERATNVRLNYGELTQVGVQDILASIDFGPKSTIMAVYTPTEDGYEFAKEVGYFYGVDNITFLRPDPERLEVIAFRESNNQSIGGLENSSFIRGYALKDGEFKNVLNVDENIETWWNDESYGKVDDPTWNKITQTSVIDNIDDDQINTTSTQIYSTSPITDNKNKPIDSLFEEQSRRTIKETYFWNDTWRTYILGEKIEKVTNKRVAILKDFGESPYILTGDLFNKYRILREDGSVDIVDYSELKEINQNEIIE